MMESLFLRVLGVSAAPSLLLLPLLAGRRWLEGRYAPQTRWGLWLAVVLVLLLTPWLPKPAAPVAWEAPSYTVDLPVRSHSNDAAAPVLPAGTGEEAERWERPEVIGGTAVQSQTRLPAQTVPKTVPETPQTAVTPPSGLTLTALAAGIWLLGMAGVLLWQGVRYLWLRRRLMRGAEPAVGLESYAARLGLKGRVAFYRSAAVPGPMTLGVLRPTVLLPPEGAAEAAVCHELYHVKRRDVAYKLLLLCACVLHWFNPLVWLMARRADRDVEACCDAAVVAGRDSDYKRSYGELLLSAAGGEKGLPFITSFGGGKAQMKARLTQLFRPGRRSRALVGAGLVLAVILSSLIACQQEKVLDDGIYCSPYANVVWPVGEPDAEGEDYGSISLSLLNYNEIDGPHGKPLGEYTLPLSKNLMLRQLSDGEDHSAGEKGTESWEREVFKLLRWPVYRNLYDPNMADYLVLTVKNGEITRLSWAQVSREDGQLTLSTETAESQPLTENTMPTLVYYDPERDFLLYRTVDTAYLHYGDTVEEFHAGEGGGQRVLWRCDVSGDEKTVYLSDVYDDSENRDERFYAWDIGARTLQEVDAIPAGVDHMLHMGSEELFYSGFMNGTSLKSNVIRTADGTLAGLYVDELIGNTIDYLQLARMREDGTYEPEGSALGLNAFLTPERIPAPQVYTDPDWGFTLRLPESMEGNYVVSRAANNWNFYNKELYPQCGYLFSLWAEDSVRQQEYIDSYPGSWPGKILGEKDGITYTLTAWTEEYLIPEELDNAGHMAMLGDTRDLSADSLDITGVTRSSGYLWPLPYTQYGSDRLLGEEDNTLRILASEGVTVQSVAGGKVVQVTAHPVTGDMSVTVAHPDGWNSEYGHLEYVEVKDGAEIKRGDIIGIAREEEGRRWLTYRLLTGGDWRTATAVDPWSVEYRTYDFLPITHDNVTIAGDPDIENTLQSVLRGERGFYNVETGEYCYADALPHSDGQSVTVYRFTELDMDNDTIPEVVLWLQRGEDVYLLGSIILHYEDGVVCGYPMGYRSMNLETLKADGTYAWSGGAPYHGWGRKDFLRDETVNTVWRDYDKFYVNGVPATEEAYDRAVEEQDAKPDVEWRAFDEEMSKE